MAKRTEKDVAIEKSMKLLEISREEAEELWAFDHDEVDNATVDAIEQKTEEKAKTKKTSSLDKVKYMKAKKKTDACKIAVIADIFTHVLASDVCLRAQQMTATKMSFVDAEGNHYTVSITKHKTCPDGYIGDPDHYSIAE